MPFFLSHVECCLYAFCLLPFLPFAEPGRLMAHFYLSFKTMQAITQAPQRAKQDALLWIIAGASELSCETRPSSTAARRAYPTVPWVVQHMVQSLLSQP